MLALISGGSGSGKSQLAEKLAVRLADNSALYYVATMMRGHDDESARKIARHRDQRAGHGFITVERPFAGGELAYSRASAQEIAESESKNSVQSDGVILLECLSNLLANEMFLRSEQGLDYLSPEQAAEIIWYDLMQLAERSRHLVIVSNEVFADAMVFDDHSRSYLRLLGWLNQKLAEEADLSLEVYYGLPIVHKGNSDIQKNLDVPAAEITSAAAEA
ncbi:MAG: bifunctional adenosylcobinamide kinase/adenosylcobinamide-phosphate guanylyltransferase [Eubacteriales bacterium]|nr:bifunctional adenosylcobinamide kinase/adenosylcobinamide-phosphate guanylyltransferase [Eubacteriales bacterium]